MRLGSLGLALALTSMAFAAPQNHQHRASPFDAIRWEGATPQVQVADQWYRPVSIDGLAVTEIIEYDNLHIFIQFYSIVVTTSNF